MPLIVDSFKRYRQFRTKRKFGSIFARKSFPYREMLEPHHSDARAPTRHKRKNETLDSYFTKVPCHFALSILHELSILVVFCNIWFA